MANDNKDEGIRTDREGKVFNNARLNVSPETLKILKEQKGQNK